MAEQILPKLIQIIGATESLIGFLAFLTIAELLIRRTLAKRTKGTEPKTWTVFIARAGMVIMAVTMGAAVYAAFVNAIGFFLLDKLRHIHAVSGDKFDKFANLYLASVGYDLAPMELINWLTTFGIGTFLVTGIAY
jgi:hypothetical protein